MKTLNHTLLLFTIIVIEGYVVLASELLAIRQTVPYVGSGTDTISIIIAAVLMPLAFGYQSGGRFKPHKSFGQFITVRKKLLINIVISASILLIGMSYEPLKYIFVRALPYVGIEDRITQISVYCLLFIVFPVYLLGQTVPLVSNYFSKEKLSQITGKMLCFSTIGSFLGAVFSTLVLMATLGVHHTVSLNFILLTILVILLSKKKLGLPVIYMCIISLAAMYLNSDDIMYKYRIRKNNQYHVVAAGKQNGDRNMYIDGNFSSRKSKYGRKHEYVEFVERIAIMDHLDPTKPPIDVLSIGAGGFTFGEGDEHNNYTYVDIDEDLQGVAEKYILQHPLEENKEFIAKPARAFLQTTDKKYDIIFLDTYQGGASIPEHMVTQEYFASVKERLKDGGILLSNLIMTPNFNSPLARNMDNTVRSVFPHVSRHVINENYHLWATKPTLVANVIYIYRHEDNYDEGKIYTDNKNTVFYDKPRSLRE